MTSAPLSVLDRPVYGLSEAAELLGLRTQRVRSWLDGYTRDGITHSPVIRQVPTGSDIVTWGEFVELGYLREYRRHVPLQRLRPVIDKLREQFETPYPLATSAPFVHGKELVLQIQEETGLPSSFGVVVRSGQEIILGEEAKSFLRKVDFDPPARSGGERLDAVVTQLRPSGKTSPVVMDPLIRGGRPSVHGVTTERLWELYDAGEDLTEIAEGYDMALEDIKAAISYEEMRRGAVA